MHRLVIPLAGCLWTVCSCAQQHEPATDAGPPDAPACDFDASARRGADAGAADVVCPVQPPRDYGDCDDYLGHVFDGRHCVPVRGCGCPDGTCRFFNGLMGCLACGEVFRCNWDKLVPAPGYDAPVCIGQPCDFVGVDVRGHRLPPVSATGRVSELEDFMSCRWEDEFRDLPWPAERGDCWKSGHGASWVNVEDFELLCALSLVEYVTTVRCIGGEEGP